MVIDHAPEPSAKPPYTARATISVASPAVDVTVALARPEITACSRASLTTMALLSIP